MNKRQKRKFVRKFEIGFCECNPSKEEGPYVNSFEFRNTFRKYDPYTKIVKFTTTNRITDEQFASLITNLYSNISTNKDLVNIINNVVETISVDIYKIGPNDDEIELEPGHVLFLNGQYLTFGMSTRFKFNPDKRRTHTMIRIMRKSGWCNE